MADPINVSERRTSPQQAKSVLLRCPLCNSYIEAVFPYGSTNQKKMEIRHNIITDHAKVCTGGTAEVQRVYVMDYPRA